MVDMKVETTEPDPSANSIGNDQTVNSEDATVPGQIIGKSDEIEGAKTGDEEMHENESGEISIQEKPDIDTEAKQTTTSKPGEAPTAPSTEEASEQPGKERDKVAEPSSTPQGAKDGNLKTAQDKENGQSSKRDKPKGSGYYQSQNIRNRNRENIKTDFTSQKETDDPVEIRKQVEFYFSDSNLPIDKFLLEKVGGSQNNPVKISLIHEFRRMRHFQPYSAVVAALKDSTSLEVTDNESIRRKVPIESAELEEATKVYQDKTMHKSIYAKGFGEETASTQFDIEAFFAPYGPTNAIRLRRTSNMTFKSSVFVEFDNEATQKAFLALEPKPKWKGQDLLIMSKYNYVKGKGDDIRSGKIKPTVKEWPKKERTDGRDWKTRRDEDQKSGFQNGRGRGGRGGRGNPGRGRGSDQRGGRGNGRDRNREREGNGGSKEKQELSENRGEDTPTIKTETANENNPTPTTSTSEHTISSTSAETKKRSREEDGEGDDQARAKKVDMKSDVNKATDKKRAHEDYGEGEG